MLWYTRYKLCDPIVDIILSSFERRDPHQPSIYYLIHKEEHNIREQIEYETR